MQLCKMLIVTQFSVGGSKTFLTYYIGVIACVRTTLIRV